MGSLVLLLSATAAQAANLVAYEPALGDEDIYLTDAGHTVTVWDDATWQAADAGDFAAFDAILVGQGGCGDPTAPSGFWANAALWGPLVTGNVFMHGFDDHNSDVNDYDGLIVNCGGFASSGEGLGLCISIQCLNIDEVAAPEGGAEGTFTIPGIGEFEVDGESGNGIVIVAPEHPAMLGLTDAGLDCWGDSVHQHIQSFPDDFDVLAVDNGVACGDLGSDGAEAGEGGVTGPVIVARGREVLIQDIPTLSIPALVALAVALAALAALVLKRRARA